MGRITPGEDTAGTERRRGGTPDRGEDREGTGTETETITEVLTLNTTIKTNFQDQRKTLRTSIPATRLLQ